MLIDWFTVVAQVFNFLALVWLMKRYLYKPIINAIDAREKQVAAELADAANKKAEAKKEQDEFKNKNAEFDQKRAALLSKATDDAKTERERLLDEARKAAATLSSRRQETLEIDERNLHQAILLRTQKEVFAIARKVLTDLAGASLEASIVGLFIRRLHELNEEQKKRLVWALKTSQDSVVVRSTFVVSQEQSTSVEGAIKELLGPETQIQFHSGEDLICGIELTTDGQKVSWNIADYLVSLEKCVDELVKKDQIAVKSEKKSVDLKNEPRNFEHGI